VIELDGYYFDGRTSKQRRASLTLHDDGEVHLTAEGEVRAFQLRELEIAPRVGNTPRSVLLPHAGKFETSDNDAVDAMLRRLGRGSGSRLLHLLETRLHLVALALAAVVLSVWGFVQYGIPTLARVAAFALPAETNAVIGRGTLGILDRSYLEPSTLDASTRGAIVELFGAVTREETEEHDFELVFRKGGPVGANALALPSGTVILTDELVDLIEHDGELIAVLAHEVGHVVQRHALRQAIQSSMVVMAAILMTGDLSSTTSIVAAVPTLLVEARFSRAFEREADDHALAHLRRARVAPVHFANLTRRMQARTGGEGSISSFLSSHPSSADRIRRFAEPAP
jgi:hypothetical protein